MGLVNFAKNIARDLRNPADRWGMIWRLLTCPVTIPLCYFGLWLVGLSQFIAHGKWWVPAADDFDDMVIKGLATAFGIGLVIGVAVGGLITWMVLT